MRIGQGLLVISTRKLGFSLAEDLFFLRSPDFGQQNGLNLSEDRPKSGSRSFDVVSILRKSPPPPRPLQIPGYAPDCLHDLWKMVLLVLYYLIII